MTAWVVLQVSDVPFLEDALYYEEVAVYVANDWLAGNQSVWLTNAIANGTNGWLLVAFIAAIYTLFGGLRVLPLLLVAYAAISAITPLIIYRVTNQLGGDRRAARFAGNLVAFSPCFAFWSGALYKEGLIYLALAVAVHEGLKLQQGIRLRSLILLVATIAVLAALRFYLGPIFILAVGVSLLWGHREQGARLGAGAGIFVRQLAAVTLLLGSLYFIVGPSIQRVLPADISEAFSRMELSRRDLARASSGYLHSADVSDPGKAMRALPIGMGYFLSVPLPWQFGRARQNLVIPETLIWLLLYPLMLVGLAGAWRSNRQGVVLIVVSALLMTALYGLFISNIGTAYRMRSQVWLLGAAFAGMGWSAMRGRRNTAAGGRQPYR